MNPSAIVASTICILGLAMMIGTAPCAAQADALAAGVARDLPELIELYRHLHANPELSFHEEKTADRIAAELTDLGFRVATKIGGHGIVGVFENGEGPTVMLRTDLDALPIVEETGLPYASRVRTTDGEGKEVGVMHACGHDVHMTVFVGVARRLVAMREHWSGTLLMIGQPAEERGKGAKAMLADGLFERFPRPDAALALHVNATLPAGVVGTCPGYALANVDSVDVVVRGVGGHGAYPHTTKDPVVLAARIVTALQTLVSREVSPLDSAVVTVGSIHGGTKHNIIGERVKLELTVRSYTDAVRRRLLDGIRRIARGEAIAAGVPEDRMPEVTLLDESIPSTFNDPELTKSVTEVLRNVLGPDRVVDAQPVMGGEDFGCYGRVEPPIPICMFWLGAVDPKRVQASRAERTPLPSLHSSRFAPLPEDTIATGVRAMTSAALRVFEGGVK